MNTPCGLLGSSNFALDVLIPWTSWCRAESCPITRSASLLSRLRICFISSLTILPTGIPVQSEIISLMICALTRSNTKGFWPCTLLNSSRSAAMSSWALWAVVSCWRCFICSTSALSFCHCVWVCSISHSSWASFCFRSCNRSWWIGKFLCSFSKISYSSLRLCCWASIWSNFTGCAFWVSATRAAAVSSTLIALSGSWRPLI